MVQKQAKPGPARPCRRQDAGKTQARRRQDARAGTGTRAHTRTRVNAPTASTLRTLAAGYAQARTGIRGRMCAKDRTGTLAYAI